MKKLKEKGPSLKERIKNKIPRIYFCFKTNKSKVGKAAFVIVPLVVAAVGAGVGIYFGEKGKAPTQVEVTTNKVNHRIYLVSSDNLTIPLTVSFNKRDTIQEEMLEVFSLLKEDSKANSNSIKGLIPKDTKMNSLELFDNELTLDLSKEFLEYNANNESKLLESIVYTYSEFPGVDMVTLYVDGQRVEKLPKNNTVVPMCATTSIGINRESKSASEIAGKQMINVYYQKTIDDKNYIVPVSQYVSKETTSELQFVNAINTPLTEKRGLTKLSDYELINKIQDDNDDNKFVLNLKDDSLVEKGVVKRSLYDLVSLTLDGFVDSKEISFKVENEEMMVEGLLDPEVYEVSSYIYNQVQL